MTFRCAIAIDDSHIQVWCSKGTYPGAARSGIGKTNLKPCSSPIIVVEKKKDRSIHLCVSYRQLNKKTRRKMPSHCQESKSLWMPLQMRLFFPLSTLQVAITSCQLLRRIKLKLLLARHLACLRKCHATHLVIFSNWWTEYLGTSVSIPSSCMWMMRCFFFIHVQTTPVTFGVGVQTSTQSQISS